MFPGTGRRRETARCSGGETAVRISASRSNRSRILPPWANSVLTTFTAAIRPVFSFVALYTTPIAPEPTTDSIRNDPSFSPTKL